MGKCDICGKKIKAVAAHKKRMHPAASGDESASRQTPTRETEDEYVPNFLRGELGEINDIAAAGEPMRALEMHANYIKGQKPLQARQVRSVYAPESDRWHKIHSRPIVDDGADS